MVKNKAPLTFSMTHAGAFEVLQQQLQEMSSMEAREQAKLVSVADPSYIYCLSTGTLIKGHIPPGSSVATGGGQGAERVITGTSLVFSSPIVIIFCIK